MKRCTLIIGFLVCVLFFLLFVQNKSSGACVNDGVSTTLKDDICCNNSTSIPANNTYDSSGNCLTKNKGGVKKN